MAPTGHRSVQTVMGYYQSGEVGSTRAARLMDDHTLGKQRDLPVDDIEGEPKIRKLITTPECAVTSQPYCRAPGVVSDAAQPY
jgi:hypothetical protein